MQRYPGEGVDEPEPSQTYDEMYQDDGYVEIGVAEPGTMQEADPTAPDFLSQEEGREEVHELPGDAGSDPTGLNPPQRQRQAPDADVAIDRGYMEDRETERDQEEDRGSFNAENIDPVGE